VACSPELARCKVESVSERETDDEEEQVQGRVTHRDFAAACDWGEGRGSVRQHGISESALYKWKARYSGLQDRTRSV